MEFLACPAYLNDDGSVRCGLPAEVTCRFTMRSSDGPLESVMIQCPARHHFNAPVEFLTFEDGSCYGSSRPTRANSMKRHHAFPSVAGQ
jgi:hypothetical protein